MSLAQTTIRGVLWNFTELLFRRGIAAGTTLLLAYFLSPTDFGLISMSALFLAIAAGVMDSGLREALVRRKYLSPRLLSAAMIASLTLGIGAYLLLFFTSPWIAEFYSEPRLTMLIRVGGLQILIGAIQTVPVAKLQQKLDFKSLMHASFPAALISSLLAIFLAWSGWGVWALVVQTLAASAIMALLVLRLARVRICGELNLQLLMPLYHFGYRLFLSGLIALTVRHAVPGLLGKFLGAASSGYYYFVDRIMELIMGQLVYSVQNVTYPAFSKMGHQQEFLRESYRKVIQVMVFAICPLLAIGAGISEYLFKILFSPAWWPAAECFRWLCAAYMLYPLHALNLNILKVNGRSDLFLRLEIIKAIIAFSVLALTLPYGLEAVLLGQVVVSFLCYLPNSWFSKSLIGYTLQAQIADVFPYFVCALISGAVALLVVKFLNEIGVFWAVLSSVIVSLLIYIFLGKILKLRAVVLIFHAMDNYRQGRA